MRGLPGVKQALDRLDRRVRRRAVCNLSPRLHVATQCSTVDQSATRCSSTTPRSAGTSPSSASGRSCRFCTKSTPSRSCSGSTSLFWCNATHQQIARAHSLALPPHLQTHARVCVRARAHAACVRMRARSRVCACDPGRLSDCGRWRFVPLCGSLIGTSTRTTSSPPTTALLLLQALLPPLRTHHACRRARRHVIPRTVG